MEYKAGENYKNYGEDYGVNPCFNGKMVCVFF